MGDGQPQQIDKSTDSNKYLNDLTLNAAEVQSEIATLSYSANR